MTARVRALLDALDASASERVLVVDFGAGDRTHLLRLVRRDEGAALLIVDDLRPSPVDHTRALRAFRRARATGGTAPWDEAQVLLWARLARIVEHYPVIARLDGCPCGAERKWLYSVTSLPDGTLSKCRRCGAEAIVVDG